MSGHWGGGTGVATPLPVCSPHQRKICNEARAAAAWLWVQSEVASAFERFSKDLLAIHGRGLNAAAALDVCLHIDAGGLSGDGGTPESTGGAGARDALNSLLLFCSEAGAEADRFASALKSGVIQPVDDALEPLARAADGALPANTAGTPIAEQQACSNEVQKAARRLQLAEEELTVSQWGQCDLGVSIH